MTEVMKHAETEIKWSPVSLTPDKTAIPNATATHKSAKHLKRNRITSNFRKNTWILPNSTLPKRTKYIIYICQYFDNSSQIPVKARCLLMWTKTFCHQWYNNSMFPPSGCFTIFHQAEDWLIHIYSHNSCSACLFEHPWDSQNHNHNTTCDLWLPVLIV